MKIAISIVSHQQADIVAKLLDDIQKYCSQDVIVVLTINIPEKNLFQAHDYPFPLMIIRNEKPKGFSENHNAALQTVNADFYCVMNPDIRLTSNPFPSLLSVFENSRVGVVAPLVTNAQGETEDSARFFPTPLRLLKRITKKFCNKIGRYNVKTVVNKKSHNLNGLVAGAPRNEAKYSVDYHISNEIIYPDWVAGMFMLFPRNIYLQLKGFDAGYYLYVEDADICYRLKLAGYKVVLSPRVTVIHNAARTSHKRFRYLLWHLKSLLRFFIKRLFN